MLSYFIFYGIDPAGQVSIPLGMIIALSKLEFHSNDAVISL